MIYLDNQATTPLAPEAKAAMLPWLGGPDSTHFGNPHSAHRLGRSAAAAIAVAREQVAGLFPPGGQVIFTGSATEAINLALRGLPGEGTIAVSATEHAAVLDTAKALGKADIIPVDRGGIAETPADLKNLRAVCVMQVNNEIGTIQPVDSWGQYARAAGGLLVCDAVQGAGRLAPPSADIIAVSAHKLYGPKGIGALWLRDGIELDATITGGGQEQHIRSGTLSPALCAGFGAAAALMMERQVADMAHIEKLWLRAREMFASWEWNGCLESRWHGNINIRREGLDAARLMSDLRDIMFSAGSACSSGSGRPSHVLRAIGLSDVQAKSSIRLGLGRYTQIEELERAAEQINQAAKEQGI